MKESLRRITTSTLIVGLLLLSFVTVQQLVSLCTEGTPSCLVAAVSFGVPDFNQEMVMVNTEQSISTPAVALSVPSIGELVVSFVQIVSVYLILFSIIILVVLEFLELRYLRQLLQRKSA